MSPSVPLPFQGTLFFFFFRMQRFWRRTRPFDDDFFFSPYGSLVLFSFILDHYPADTLQIKTCLGFFFFYLCL